MTAKVTLSLPEIKQRLQACTLPVVDRVIGIGSGGSVPAALVAYELGCPLTILPINYRAPDNSPRYAEPQLLGAIDLADSDQRLLLVDDVSVSGKTLDVAKAVLAGREVTMLVMKGKADIVLFPEVSACVNWPWQPAPPPVFVVMGVSGSGKTTVGEALAQKLNVPFYDADDYHPPENVAKMSSGIPLNDADRAPWLDRLHDIISDHIAAGTSAVLTCSALKQAYQDRLRGGHTNVQFVYLDGSFDLIWERMAAREGHYMKSEMLQSQFEALEQPSEKEAIVISVALSPDEIVGRVIKILSV
jgi:gluconokinase